MGMPEQEFAQLAERFAANRENRPLQQVSQMELTKPARKEKPRMNKWEQAYAAMLDARKQHGKIAWFGFEAVTLRLAEKTRYTPDFAVLFQHMDPTGAWLMSLEFHEVKGFWRDDARVKIKVAAEIFPFRFVGVTRDRKTGEWQYEQFPGRRG